MGPYQEEKAGLQDNVWEAIMEAATTILSIET